MTIFDKIDEEKELMTININKDIALPTLAEMGCKLQILLNEYERKEREEINPLKKKIRKIKKKYLSKIEKIKSLKEKIAEKMLPNLADPNLPVRKKITTKNGIVYLREKLDFEIEDINQIPKEYLVVDSKKIKEALKMGLEIPGVRRNDRFTVVFKSI